MALNLFYVKAFRFADNIFLKIPNSLKIKHTWFLFLSLPDLKQAGSFFLQFLKLELSMYLQV